LKLGVTSKGGGIKGKKKELPIHLLPLKEREDTPWVR